MSEKQDFDWAAAQAGLEASLLEVLPALGEWQAKLTSKPIWASPSRVCKLAADEATLIVEWSKRKPEWELLPEAERAQLANAMRARHLEIMPEFKRVLSAIVNTDRRMADFRKQAPASFWEHHRQYQEFVVETVKRLDPVVAHRHLSRGLNHLLPLFQSLAADGPLPKALQREPRRLTTPMVRKQLEAWRAMSGHWEQSLRLAYGLLRLGGGEGEPAWGKPALWNLVGDHLAPHPQLAGLTCQGKASVTIRNALDHGQALPNPQTRKVEFTDINRTVTRDYDEIRPLAIDMVCSVAVVLDTTRLVMNALRGSTVDGGIDGKRDLQSTSRQLP